MKDKSKKKKKTHITKNKTHITIFLLLIYILCFARILD